MTSAQHDGPDESPEQEPAAVRAVAAPDPLIGQLVDERFKILSVIARGGMGKVYRAEQAPLGRICALKILSPSYEGDGDPEFYKRFFLEASTAAKLSHPNTVTIFDYGKDEALDIYFIAMEYIEGKTLHRTLREEGPLGEIRTGHIARQVCRSLREAHKLGVVHRDLKPANILLTNREDERDSVKVLDFGLVKDVTGTVEQDLTQAGLFMGSPKYMSPEQITGAPITPATDVYSLGVMLFEMLTGKVPFDRGKSVMTLMAHVNDPVPRLDEVRPGLVVSTALENIVMCCLEKAPEARFRSMDDLLAALKLLDPDALRTGTYEAVFPGGAGEYAPPPSMTPLSISGSGPLARPAPGSSSGATDIVAMSSTPPAPMAPSGSPSLPSGDPFKPASRGSSKLVMGLVALIAAGGAAAYLLSTRPPTVAEPIASASHAAVGPSAPTTSTLGTAAETTAAQSSAAPAVTVKTARVTSTPPGARVIDGTTTLCESTPCDIEVAIAADGSAKRVVAIERAGYRSATVTVDANDGPKSVNLAPAGPRHIPTKNTGATDTPTNPPGYKTSPY